MNLDTAELADVERTGAGVQPSPPTSLPLSRAAPRASQRSLPVTRLRAGRGSILQALRDARARIRSDPARMAALRDSTRALAASRALVWLAGVGTVLAFGYGPLRKAFNPPGVTRGLGWLGNLLAAPAARWDAAWYLVIAHYGYRPELGSYTEPRAAFFPLYPLAIRAVSWLAVPPVAAGVAVSVAALGFALYGIHRLTALELLSPGSKLLAGARCARAGELEPARLAVLLVAFAPMAFFLSAVYSESLYLALSVGLFWCARRGRWAWAGPLGALAAATRSAGLVLIVPALILYLYGPREDCAPDRAGGGLRPRYKLRPDVLWLALLPLGVLLYGAYLGFAGGDPLAPFHAQEDWSRHFAGPFVGAWDGFVAAFDGVRQLLSFQRQHVYFASAGGDPVIAAWHNLMLFAFLAAAVPAIVGVARRLPLAYAAYVLAALALPLSYPVSSQPLMSLPRFLLVLFPLAMWSGAWLSERPRLVRPALVCSALSMVVFLAQFATWHWVA